MKDLPKLVKPYYTIEEAFNRLKLAGADLSKIEDIFLLARENALEIKLLLGVDDVVLINNNDSIPFLRPGGHWLNYTPSNEDIDDFVAAGEGTLEDVTPIIDEFNSATFMISNEFLVDGVQVKDIKIYNSSEKDSLVPASPNTSNYIHSCKYYPILVTPLTMIGSYVRWSLQNRFDKIDLAENKTRNDWFSKISTFAVEFNNEIYFVCKPSGGCSLTDDVNAYFDLDNGKMAYARFFLDRTVIPELLNFDKSRVVTIESLIAFEQKYLGIRNEVSLKDNSKSFNINNLFTNTPKTRKPELLKLSMRLAERHIKSEGSYPDAIQLWNMLIHEYADDYDPKHRVIECLSGLNGLSDKAFRKKFDEWTKKTVIKAD